MTEHCVCAHCRLAEAERKLERLQSTWSLSFYAQEAMVKLQAAIAEHEATLGLNPFDAAQAERMSNARVELLFAAKDLVNQLPAANPRRADPTLNGYGQSSAVKYIREEDLPGYAHWSTPPSPMGGFPPATPEASPHPPGTPGHTP